MADLTVVDPVAAAINWLAADTGMFAAFGHAGFVSGIAEPPWPHLAVIPGPGGDLRDLRWDMQFEVLLEVTGDLAGAVSDAACWKLAVQALQSLTAMRDYQPDPLATPLPYVVSDVTPSGTYARNPLPTGQRRWTVGALLVMHPNPAAS